MLACATEDDGFNNFFLTSFLVSISITFVSQIPQAPGTN